MFEYEKCLEIPVIAFFKKRKFSTDREFEPYPSNISRKRIDLLFTNKKRRIAVELKLHDWKKGVKQCTQNSVIFDETFLALPSNQIKNVNMEDLKELGVGLISVGDKVQIVLKAKA